MPFSRLVLVSGLPAAGKTTLAHAIGTRVPCPVVSRDEIKEGLVHARGGGTPEWGAPVAHETFALFYRTVGELIRSGCSVVAEAAYFRDLSQEVAVLVNQADACIIHCQVDRDVALARFIERAAAVTEATKEDGLRFESTDKRSASPVACSELP